MDVQIRPSMYFCPIVFPVFFPKAVLWNDDRISFVQMEPPVLRLRPLVVFECMEAFSILVGISAT